MLLFKLFLSFSIAYFSLLHLAFYQPLLSASFMGRHCHTGECEDSQVHSEGGGHTFLQTYSCIYHGNGMSMFFSLDCKIGTFANRPVGTRVLR